MTHANRKLLMLKKTRNYKIIVDTQFGNSGNPLSTTNLSPYWCYQQAALVIQENLGFHSSHPFRLISDPCWSRAKSVAAGLCPSVCLSAVAEIKKAAPLRSVTIYVADFENGLSSSCAV